MISRSDLAAIFRRVADEIEKVDVPPKTDVPIQLVGINPIPIQVGQQVGVNPALAPEPPKPAPPPPAVQAAQPAPPAPPAAGPKPVVDLDTIKGIQQALNQIRSPNFPKLEENGVHDAIMTYDLKYFQATAGIPVTGAIDEITINTLHKAIFGTSRT